MPPAANLFSKKVGPKNFYTYPIGAQTGQAGTKEIGACPETTNYKLQITNKVVPYGHIVYACGDEFKETSLNLIRSFVPLDIVIWNLFVFCIL
jgi:hypothetical protein